jgi:hypothetical protein
MTSSEVGARIARRNVRERAADANQRALALPASPVAGTSETLGANSPEGGLTPSPGAPSRPAGGGPSGGGGAVVPITFNHFRRRDYDKYAVDVPKELPASAKRTKKFCDSATNTLWGALGIPKLDGEGSGSKLVEQTEGAMRLIRKRMIEHGTLLNREDGGADDDNAPRCAHCRARLTVALAGNVRAWRFGARPDEPLRLTTDAFSAEQAKKEGGIEVDVSMFVRQPNTGVGSSSRGAAAALTSGDANTGDAPLVGAVLPPFAGTPAAAGVVAMTAPEALARAFEYGFEVDGVAYAPLSQWHAQARIAAWKRVSSCERRRLTNGFSERLAVYYAAAHDFRGLRDEGVALLKEVSAEEKRQGRKPRDRFDVVVGVVVDRLAQRASENAARAAAATTPA